MYNCLLITATFANDVTQVDFDEWVKDSGVSSLVAPLYLESLDDPRVIIRCASQSTSANKEVL